ncbi:hypothetical protein JCM6882_004269 [Rhodosporidiobolus microsporus]
MPISNDYPPAAPFEQWYGLPKGDATCQLTAFSFATLALPEKWGIHPVGSEEKSNRHPILVSLIRHETTGKLALFDLGLPKEWETFLAPEKHEAYEMFDVKIEADADEALAKAGVKAEDVDLLVISHKHFDHTGKPALFPNAQIIVGPDELPIASLEGHTHRVKELSWHASPTHIAAFEHSYDVWGDGSFVVVSAPGHTAGHLAALVRTSPPSADEGKEGDYVLLAADCAHHPALLSSRPEDAHYTLGRWREPGDSLDHPPKHSNYDDFELAAHTWERVKACARRDEVMVVLAHNFEQWARWGGGEEKWSVELNGWRKRGLK